MIEYHNSDAQVAVDEMPYDLSVAITGKESARIGLLANGFPDSVSFLDEVGKALRKLRPSIEVTAYNKGNASVPAGEQLLGEIGGECVGVIAAYGH